MQRKNSTLSLWTDLDHNLKFERELIEIGPDKISVDATKGKIEVRLDQIKGAYVEEGLGIGKLVVKTNNGGELELAYFTKELMPNFKRLALALDEYKNKKVLDFVPSNDEDKKKADRIGTIRWILDFIKPYRKALLTGIALSIVATVLSLVPAYMLKILIDNVLLVPNPPIGLFEELTVILILAYGFSTLMSIIQTYVLSNVGQQIVNDLRAKVYERALDFSAGMMDKITSGRVLTRLTTDAGNTQWLMAFGFPTILVNVLTVVGIGVILFSMDWNLAIYVLIPAPFVVYALIKYRTKSHKAYHKNWRRSSDMINTMYDTIYSYSVVKSFAKERFENTRLGEMLGKVYDSNKEIVRLNLTYWQTVGFLTSLSTVIIWWIGGNQVIGGVIQVGVITAFVAYMVMFYSPINQLSSILPFMQQALTSGDRIREVIDKDIDIRNIKNPKRPKLTGNIEFNDVWFGYDPYVPVIENFSMNLKSGHNIAVVGRSGSGKSTISKLMLRFYEANRGTVKISNTDIKDIDLGYLRDRIAYVPQDVVLFDNSVAYNIKYGSNREIKDSEIIASARAARVHEELMQLPLSYDTDLGERGWSLSGGQRQRLSIARAVIKKPDIVILDEATSNLDVESEQEIYSAILNLTKGKTTIFVTHNMNEVMHSNKVLMMKKGKIVEEGHPKELLKKKGEFHKMFSKQMSNWDSKIVDPAKNNPSIESYMKDSVQDYGTVKIIEGVRGSKVDAKVNGELYKNLMPKLPFPITNVRFVMLYDEKGVPKVVLENYSKLSEKSRDVLHTAILLSTFKPMVSTVYEIDIKGDELEWHVRVGGKERRIITKGRRNVIQYGDKIVLSDVRDNLYEINLKELDKKSFEMVAATI